MGSADDSSCSCVCQRLRGTGANAPPGNIQATAASLDAPAGIAYDTAGNLYIADLDHNVIREVTVAGIITALASDGSGNLYLADTDNHRIRKITGITITTVAGDGEQFFSGDGAAATAAGLDSPNGVAVNVAGNIYIGDTHNQRVRVVNASGIISTLAGNASKSFAGDGGIAKSASLARPRGLSVDSAGNIYIADSDNNGIRLIAKTGNITTVAGNGFQGFARDGGPAVNAALDTPRAPVVQASGVFALSDTRNQLVRQVDLNGVIHTISGNGSGTGSGQGFFETLTLSGASVVAFGTGTLTATFSNSNLTATGQVTLLDITSGSIPRESLHKFCIRSLID
jgi:sugar lactone lactonase YvrE